jgi:uncharacterized protein YyaL (SSP411 family)
MFCCLVVVENQAFIGGLGGHPEALEEFGGEFFNVPLIESLVLLVQSEAMDSSASPAHTNRLIHEKSPYLLQHAHNPVDWYPWGEEAFEKAKKEDKPLFLSIGYSTCHWCHVMAHESFENEEVARFMNEHFVSVKVDREERPDLDQIYINAVMILTGQGGWPLNVFLTPDLKPFFGGTYFAPESRHGRPPFLAILQDMDRVWKTEKARVEKAGGQLAEFIAGNVSNSGITPTALDESVIQKAVEDCKLGFEPKAGGFSGAPKFPRPMTLGFLLRALQKTKDKPLLHLVELTLDKMYQGGLYDQVGGGFSRYSTDNEWLVPHFEKMLYDNALLAKAYLEAYQVTGNEEYARVARETFAYLLRDMRDADSEGEEGKFYIWKTEELKAVLGEKDGDAFGRLYNVTQKGNFEGRNILHLQTGLPAALKEIGKNTAWWKSAREKVLLARSKRPRPHRDDKVLVSWNSLVISSLAYGFQVLGDPEYLKAAKQAASFIDHHMIRKGRLLSSWCRGPSDVEGFLDDYAFYQAALLDLYESTFDFTYLAKAIGLYKEMIPLFWDEKEGGLFFTASDQKDRARLLARQKEAYDGAVPSGNSTAALNFYRLAEFTDRKDIRGKADAILKCFSGLLAKAGTNFPQMLQAYQFNLYGATEIFVTGKRDESEKILKELLKPYLPNKVLVFAEEHHVQDLSLIIPWIHGRGPKEGKPSVYICRNYQCQLPVTDVKKALQLLGI